MSRIPKLKGRSSAKPNPYKDAPIYKADNVSQAVKAVEEKKPVIQAADPAKAQITPIEDYKFDTWEEAEKFGKMNQKQWANAKVQDMVAKGQNPGEYLNMLSIYGESESPEEKAKRERRDALGETFRGLGTLIGSAANLVNAPKSGYSMDLNTIQEKHREKMQRLKDKQDAIAERRETILANAKVADSRAAAAKQAADKKAADDAAANKLKFERDIFLKELDNKLKMGQIDANNASKIKLEIAKAKNAQDLERIKQANRITLKQTASHADSVVGDSVIGDDGNVYTRSKPLTASERKQIAMSSRMYQDKSFQDKFRKKTEQNGEVKIGDIDYDAMSAEVMANKEVPISVLKSMGFNVGESQPSETKPKVKGGTSLLPNQTRKSLLPK